MFTGPWTRPCVVTCSIHDFVREELDVEANNERLAVVDRTDVSVSQGSTGVVRDVEEVDGTTGLDRIKAKKTECRERLGVRTQRSSVSYWHFHMGRSPACNETREVPRFSFSMSTRLTAVNYSVNLAGERPPSVFCLRAHLLVFYQWY